MKQYFIKEGFYGQGFGKGLSINETIYQVLDNIGIPITKSCCITAPSIIDGASLIWDSTTNKLEFGSATVPIVTGTNAGLATSPMFNALNGSTLTQPRFGAGDTYITVIDPATGKIDFVIDGVVKMSLSSTKVSFNGILIDPPTGLELMLMNANPGGVQANTVWLNSVNNHLYRGNIDLEANVVVYQAGALSGVVPVGKELGVNTTTGEFYYKNASGNWQLQPVGSTVTVIDNPNGLMTVNAGLGGVQQAIRPIDELVPLSGTLDSTLDKVAIWDASTSTHVYVSPSQLAAQSDFWRSAVTVLPDGTLDTSENIGRIGKVGVGTAIPVTNLHVNSGGVSGITSQAFIDGLMITDNTSSRQYFETTAATSGQRVVLAENTGGLFSFSSLTDNATGFVKQNIIRFENANGNLMFSGYPTTRTDSTVSQNYLSTDANGNVLSKQKAIEFNPTLGSNPTYQVANQTADTISVVPYPAARANLYTLPVGGFIGQNFILKNLDSNPAVISSTNTDLLSNLTIPANTGSASFIFDGVKWLLTSEPPVNNTKYVKTFVATEWVASGANFTMTIPQTTHLKGIYPVIRLEQLVAGNFIKVNATESVNAAGNVVLTIASPTFPGRVIIM